MPNDRPGLMIIRAGTEPGSSEPLRARLTIVTDTAAGTEETMTLSKVDDVCDTVRRWLTDLLGEADQPAGEHAEPGGR